MACLQLFTHSFTCCRCDDMPKKKYKKYAKNKKLKIKNEGGKNKKLRKTHATPTRRQQKGKNRLTKMICGQL